MNVWHLFDGKSSSDNGNQFVFSPCAPISTLESQGERIVAVVREDTQLFGLWTRDARLIATSPELLRLCKFMLGWLEERWPPDEPRGPDTIIAQLERAIARVEEDWVYDAFGEEVKAKLAQP